MRENRESMTENRERKISSIDIMVLGLLSERPMHGYEINRLLRSDVMKLWIEVPVPSIYASLSKLKRRDLVRETAEKESGRPERNIFHITRKGRKEFLDALFASLGEKKEEYVDYNIPIFFINRLAPDKTIEAIGHKKKFLGNRLASLAEVLSKANEKTEYSPSLRVVLEQTKRVNEVRLKWLDEIVRLLGGNGETSQEGISALREHPLATLRGSLAEVAFPDVIYLIVQGRRTGKLTIQKGRFVRSIFFQDGNVVAASSHSLREEGEKRKATADRGLQKSVLKDILQIFKWSEGEFIFQDGVSQVKASNKNMVHLDITNEDLIFAGCFLEDDWHRISKIVPSSDVIFDRIEGIEGILENLHLADKDKKVFMLVNGARDVQTIAHMAGLSIFETSRALYALANVGISTTVTKDKAETLRLLKDITRGLFDRLGVFGTRQINKIAREFNSWAEHNAVPFRVGKQALTDSVESGLTLSELVDYERKSLQAVIEAVARNTGASFTKQAMRSIIEHLSPDSYELFSRYGFSSIEGIR